MLRASSMQFTTVFLAHSHVMLLIMINGKRKMSDKSHTVDPKIGCTEMQLRRYVQVNMSLYKRSPGDIAASMMADAYEEMNNDNHMQLAQQKLNRAKWILSEYCMK